MLIFLASKSKKIEGKSKQKSTCKDKRITVVEVFGKIISQRLKKFQTKGILFEIYRSNKGCMLEKN